MEQNTVNSRDFKRIPPEICILGGLIRKRGMVTFVTP
jgi:hypothetical protein